LTHGKGSRGEWKDKGGSGGHILEKWGTIGSEQNANEGKRRGERIAKKGPKIEETRNRKKYSLEESTRGFGQG